LSNRVCVVVYTWNGQAAGCHRSRQAKRLQRIATGEYQEIIGIGEAKQQKEKEEKASPLDFSQ
jgi:hypothetical protein